MFTYGVSLSWMILSPIVLLSDVIAIIAITHYVPYLHGTDVTVISVLTAMAGNAMLVLPIPAYLGIREVDWEKDLCTAYVWCFLTFKVSQTLSLCVMCVHWSTVLKMSAAKKTYVTTKFLKIAIVFIWIFSATFGILPVIGAADEDFNESKSCKFLGFSLGIGFSLFFLIFNIAAIFISIICAIDATVLLKNMKHVAKTKYQTGRFHIPDKRADIPSHGPSNVIDRYHRLNFAWDLSKFVLAVAVLVSLVDLLPFTIIQGIQLFSHIDRGNLEVSSLYLIGIEALLFPHLLWLASRRYRHALVYQFKVYLLRQKEAEEDPCSCVLQSYTPRDKDRASLGPSRPPSSLGRAGGYSASGTLRSTKSVIASNDNLHAHTNGRTQITTVSAEYNGIRQNGVIQGEVCVEPHNHMYHERGIDTGEQEIKNYPSRSPISDRHVYDTNRKISESTSSTHSELSANKGKALVSRQDVKRSSSGTSRRDWKDKMKKQHLPPIFINEGFDSEDHKAKTEALAVAAGSQAVARVGHQSQGSLHYYMSSDYHPDYLTDSLPRHKIVSRSFESESEGVSGTYNDDDIDDVLDEHSTLGDGRFHDSFGYSGDRDSFHRRPYLSTFQSHLSSDNDESGPRKPSTKGVYSTFEDLRASDLREENELVFDPSTLPMNKEMDGYNSLRGIKRKPNSTGGYDWRTRSKYSSEFQDDIYRARLASVISPRFMLVDKYDPKTNPFHTIEGLQMATTSFGRTSSFDSRLKKSDRHTLDNIDDDQTSSTEKVNEYLEHNYIHETSMEATDNALTQDQDANQTRPNSTFIDSISSHVTVSHVTANRVNESRTISLTDRSNMGSFESSTDVQQVDVENESSGSNSSVTLSPYKAEIHRRPWMDDIDLQCENNIQMAEPLVEESDNETLRDSHGSNDWRYGSVAESKHSHSELSTPVSSIFDEETERGFEEALDAHVNNTSSVYGGVSLCFESIKEEPEDLTSSGSNPFLDNISNGEEEFKTQAIVSKSSRSNSRTSSCASVGDNNPFSSSPKHSGRTKTPVIVTTDIEFELGDSGFTSGLEKGNQSDSSGQHDTTNGGKVSPWPDDDGSQVSTCVDHSFESDFCSNPFEEETRFSSQTDRMDKYRVHSGTEFMSFPNVLQTTERPVIEAKKPMNKSVMDIKGHRHTPVRVKSFEASSPSSPHRPPKRGNSFEGLKTDVKPAYF